MSGPFGNFRYGFVPLDPNCSQGSFTLPNLFPSSVTPYQVWSEMGFRSGNSYEYFVSPRTNVYVPCGPGAVDLDKTFVMDPGFVNGKILLRGPVDDVANNSPSCLRYILRDTGNPPSNLELNYSYVGAFSATGGGWARVLFDGDFGTANNTDFSGPYELVLSGLKQPPFTSQPPSDWWANTLDLLFLNYGSVTPFSPYLFCGVHITDNKFGVQTINQGSVIAHDHNYCFSEVVIDVSAGGGILSYSPSIVSGNGTFVGTDFLNNSADYSVYINEALGTPTTKGTASASGQIVLFLPQGIYTLNPVVNIGSGSVTPLKPIKNLVVGCGQIIHGTPEIQINLSGPPSCNQSFISGTVTSENPVTNISYSSDAVVTPVTVPPPAGGWGISPSFSFPLTLLPCTHTYTISATDNAGHTASADTKITFDDIPPVVTCATNKTVDCGSAWSFDAPTASDNCSAVSDITIGIQSTVTNGLCPVGISRTWVAMDLCGNSASCTQTVMVVNDTTPPVITSCPTNRTLHPTAFPFDPCDVYYPDMTGEMMASDNCGPVSIVQYPSAGGYVGGGTHPVVFRVTDACGHSVFCTNYVTVHSPITINCPPDITADCNDDTGAMVPYPLVSATSRCCPGLVNVNCVPPPGKFPIGVTPVTCTAVDACGDTNICTFTVTVKGKGGPQWKSARRYGLDIGNAEERGNAIAFDNLGNIYVAGTYGPSLSQFNTTILPGYGGKSIFVAKYNAQCDLLWVTTAGGDRDDVAHGIAVDAAGNVYVTGSFQNSVTIQNPYGLANAGQEDVFVAKYDTQGTLLWARGFGGTGADSGSGIAVDGGGNCYVTGEFQGTVNLITAAGAKQLSSSGGRDCFVTKYNPSGDILWAEQSASTSGSAADPRAIAVDSSGDAYVTGVFQGTVNFVPYSVARPGGAATVFVAKCGPSGWVWAAHSGHASATRDHDGRGIGVDANGFCYVTAYFNGTADFGLHPALGTPVAANNNKTAPSDGQLYDYLVAKFLSSDGSPIWILNGKGPVTDDEEPSSLAVDAVGNCYITGFLHASATTRYVTAGQKVMVAKYNSGGVPQWSSTPAGTVTDGSPDNVGLGIAADGAGCVYVTGAFTESLTFLGLTPLVNSLASPTDVFVAKLCPDCAPLVSCPPPPLLQKTVYFDASGLTPPLIVLSWTGAGYRLQCTDSLANPMWIDVPGSSPVTVPVSGPRKFFRLICP